MRAMQLITRDEEKHLREAVLEGPRPGAGQVLVQVAAAGVTPTELNWYPTTHQRDGSVRSLAVPGHEFSGTVIKKGPQVNTFEVSETVYGMNDWFEEGATAEFCLADQNALAAKPQVLSHEQAASVPIAALTAWQGLVLKARVQKGDRVLVHGGAGAVGAFAVQIAVLQGAHVISTGSRSSFDYLKALGVSDCIDYQNEHFEQRLSPVEVCFDTVGGDTLARSWPLLAEGGRMVTIASDAELSADPKVKQAFFIVQPSGDQLTHISELFESGKLRTAVKTVLPFEEAEKAYKKPTPGFGKVVLRLPSSHNPS